jgi:hypothetical protein
MLNFESIPLRCARTVARVAERRNSRRDAGCRIVRLNIGVAGDDTRLAGATDGTVGTARLGGAGGAIRAALPTPLGSLTELLRPPALPGPRGIPLTPASCAKHDAEAASQPAKARTKNCDVPDIDHDSRVRCVDGAKTAPAQGGYAEAAFEGVSGFHSTNTAT